MNISFTKKIIVLLLIGLLSSNAFAISNNRIYVTPELCKEWNMPITSFSIEVPSDYQIEYNVNGQYYIRLRKFVNNIVVQEITIGKAKGITNVYEALQFLNGVSQLFEKQLKEYRKESLKSEKLIDQKAPQLKAIVNFDELGFSEFQGDYTSLTLVVLPNKNSTISGLCPSFLQNEGMIKHNNNSFLSAEAFSIWKTFKMEI